MPEQNLLDDLFREMVVRIENLEARLSDLNLLESKSFPLNLADVADVIGILPNANLITANGTWVPTFSGSTVAGVFTYTTQAGYYVEIGNIVFLFGFIGISAIGTPPTGNMRIGGLPVVSNATYNGGLQLNRISNFNYTAAALALGAIINTSGQIASLYETFDNIGVVAAPAANFTNANCQFIFTGVYLGA